MQTQEQSVVLPVIPLENIPQQVVIPQQPTQTQTSAQQPVQINQPQIQQQP